MIILSTVGKRPNIFVRRTNNVDTRHKKKTMSNLNSENSSIQTFFSYNSYYHLVTVHINFWAPKDWRNKMEFKLTSYLKGCHLWWSMSHMSAVGYQLQWVTPIQCYPKNLAFQDIYKQAENNPYKYCQNVKLLVKGKYNESCSLTMILS